MRYHIIESLKGKYPVMWLMKFASVSKKVYHLMSEFNIQSIIRKMRRFLKENYSIVFPNVLNHEFKDCQQNEALITDITYLRFQEGFQYFSVVQDIPITKLFLGKYPSRMIMNLC
ncbi:hypothetical protein [Bacillus cereus]|uniref:hypothetical protein n=1 Tax=Bacillus cereus TaxID=1396 RepID=UPI00114554C0|nr:hypothetical protein [Bacillus cereus]